MQWDQLQKECLHKLTDMYGEGEAYAMTKLIIEYLQRDNNIDDLDSGKTVQLNNITTRLLANEPLQYILGEAWFCGLKFEVDNRVLIPRPETEELVEWVVADCKFPLSEFAIFDVGSGSGCIPISLKRRLSKPLVEGCELSEGAIEIATRNSNTIGADVKFHRLNFLDKQELKKLMSYDVVISNPPYIPEREKTSMPSNVTLFEPSIALFVPNEDPYVFYNALAEFGSEKLNPMGFIYAEIHEDAGQAITDLFTSKGYQVQLRKDMQGKDRMVKAWFK